MSNDSNNRNEEFSLESILAEFGGKPAAPQKEARMPEIPPAKPAPKAEKPKAAPPADKKPEPAPKVPAEEKEAPKPAPEEPKKSADVPAEDEGRVDLFSNIKKSSVNSRPVPSADELKVEGAEEEDNVIDLSAYDDAYKKRSHSIRNMRRQLKAISRPAAQQNQASASC